MALPHTLEVAGTRARVHWHAQLQWRASFFIELGTTALWMGIYLAFWRVVLSSFGTFEGWTLPSLIVFVAFQELFFGCCSGLFQGAMNYWWFIHSGRLETSLTRPMDPRLSAIALNVDPYQLLRSGLMFSVFIAIALHLGFPADPLRLAVAALLALAAAVGKTLLALSVNFIAFWWQNVDALHELIGSGDHFLRVPLDVLPRALQLVFTFGVPYVFAATFPALFSAGRLSWAALLPAAAGLLTALTLLWGIQELLWRRGVRAYDGRSS